jgi:hypothetical protein
LCFYFIEFLTIFFFSNLKLECSDRIFENKISTKKKGLSFILGQLGLLKALTFDMNNICFINVSQPWFLYFKACFQLIKNVFWPQLFSSLVVDTCSNCIFECCLEFLMFKDFNCLQAKVNEIYKQHKDNKIAWIVMNVLFIMH